MRSKAALPPDLQKDYQSPSPRPPTPRPFSTHAHTHTHTKLGPSAHCHRIWLPWVWGWVCVGSEEERSLAISGSRIFQLVAAQLSELFHLFVIVVQYMDALARNCNNLFFVIISIVVVLVVVLLISLGSRMCSTFSIFIVIHTNGSLCCWIFVTMLYVRTPG